MGQERHMKHTVTHWAVTGSDGFSGFTYAVPVTIQARWEEGGELFVTAEGEQATSRAVAYLASDVAIGDYLALGEHTEENPADVEGAYRVLQYYKNTDLRNIRVERKAML